MRGAFEQPRIERVGVLEGTYLLDNRGTLLVRDDLTPVKINFEPYQQYYNSVIDNFIENMDFEETKKTFLQVKKEDIIVNPIILGDPYVWNYFHFTFDFLSKTKAINTYPCTIVLCPVAVLANKVQFDLLSRHVAPEQLMAIRCPMVVRNPIIAYSTYSGKAVDDRRRRVDLLPAGDRRLYISRKGRRPHNTVELEEVLRRYGFETVSFDDPTLSFQQQAALIEGAGLVTAPHGANMINLMYLDGPVDTIELASRAHANGALCYISNHLGRRHRPILGDPSGFEEDFIVPIDQLVEAIERFI